jgi:uncharacterized membrane protein YeiB
MNQKAYYGEFGGQYVAESLMNTLEELDKAFEILIVLFIDPPIFALFSFFFGSGNITKMTPMYNDCTPTPLLS